MKNKKERKFEKLYFLKILNKKGIYHYIVDELTLILLEESLNEKYLNYNGKFIRSITLNELKRRLKEHGIFSSPVEIGKTVQNFLNKYKINYYYRKRSPKGVVYSQITYSREKLNELIDFIIKTMGKDSLLYQHPYIKKLIPQRACLTIH